LEIIGINQNLCTNPESSTFLKMLMGLAKLRAQAGDRDGALQLAQQVLIHPASTAVARTRAEEILKMVDPQGERQQMPASPDTFEQVVQRVLVARRRTANGWCSSR
jgi:hypothetical protein